MAYQTPQLTLLGSATGLVLGSKPPLPVYIFGDHVDVLPRQKGLSRVSPEI